MKLHPPADYGLKRCSTYLVGAKDEKSRKWGYNGKKHENSGPMPGEGEKRALVTYSTSIETGTKSRKSACLKPSDRNECKRPIYSGKRVGIAAGGRLKFRNLRQDIVQSQMYRRKRNVHSDHNPIHTKRTRRRK